MYPGYFSSHFSYGLSIYANETITNVTLYVPLPVKNGVPMVGKRVLNVSDFNQGSITASFTHSPPGFNLTGTSNISNSAPWFVKLNADKIPPGPKNGSRIDPAYNIQITDYNTLTTPLIFSNTLSPVGNESIFLPKLDFTPSQPTRKESRSLDWLEYNQLMIPWKTVIYGEYFSSPSADVHGGSNIWGYNSWKEPDDASISNSFSDGYQWVHIGESHGWQTVSGTLNAGVGIYPNLSHPSWQKAIQKIQQGT